MKIRIEKNLVALLAIAVDGRHFDLLLGVNWIKKVKSEFKFEKN